MRCFFDIHTLTEEEEQLIWYTILQELSVMPNQVPKHILYNFLEQASRGNGIEPLPTSISATYAKRMLALFKTEGCFTRNNLYIDLRIVREKVEN